MTRLNKLKCWLRSVIYLWPLLFASVCVAAMTGLAQVSQDLTWPLLFNGIVPGGLLAFVGKRYIDKQDKTNKELIETKNAHTSRLDGIEMIHQLRGCDQPDKILSGRRKDDK